jgi:hypothetical protein
MYVNVNRCMFTYLCVYMYVYMKNGGEVREGQKVYICVYVCMYVCKYI